MQVVGTGLLRAQPATPPDDSAARRALRVVKEIARPDAQPVDRATSYRAAARILDSAEAAGGRTPLLDYARGLALLYRAEAALGEARRARRPSVRCAAAREARLYADSVLPRLPGGEHASPAYQALFERAYRLPDSAAAVLRSCR
jgi:hypothetical protein